MQSLSPAPTPAPDPNLYTLTSLLRGGLFAIFGAAGLSQFVQGLQGQLLIGIGALVLAVAWVVLKNNRIVAELISAMTSPAVVLTDNLGKRLPVVAIPLLLFAVLMVGAGSGLSACTTANVLTTAQIAEQTDTDAALLYSAIAIGVNTYEAAPGVSAANSAAAEKVKVKAWEDYQTVHALYVGGTLITAAALATLQTDQSSAATVTGSAIKVAAPAADPHAGAAALAPHA